LITAQAKVNGGYSAMGIFTGGSQVTNTSVFNWYQATGTVNNGLQGTWVLTVTTPTVYTINAWGGGTVSAGTDGTAVANYIQINPTFALTAISGLTTTSDVNVGGNLNVTGTGGNVLTKGSISTTQNITGSLVISGSVNIISTTALQIGTGSGDEGGEIVLAKAITNTSLTGSGITIDSYQNRIRIFEQGGNARGVFMDLSKAPNGVSGELTWKASGLVNAGVDVTLGNLKARIPTSGYRSLQVSTVSGTYSVYGSSVYSYNGIGGITVPSGTPVSVTTTPTYLSAGYNFIVAGATDTWNIMDTSAGIAWRITMIIGDTYLNNFISIERLH
jgi:hypothetical protein